MGDLVKRLRECADCKDSEAWRRLDGGQDLCIGAMLANDAADHIEALEAEVARLKCAIDRQAGASRTLRASIMAEVQAENAHLRAKDRNEYTATATLESERQANAMLTAEIDRLTAALERTEENRDAILADLAGVAAERDTARAETATAFEVSARAASEYLTTGGFYQAESHGFTVGQGIRAKIPTHATAALAARDRRKVAEGVRLAATRVIAGSLGRTITSIRGDILALAAHIEAGEEAKL